MDFFDLTFDTLRSSLVDDREGRKHVSALEMINRKFDAVVAKDIVTQSNTQLLDVQSTRQSALNNILDSHAKIRLQAKCLSSSQSVARESCRCVLSSNQRRLKQQITVAENRMRELVFEIVGEYGKGEVRLNRRREYLIRTGELAKVWLITKLMWERFALRLCHDISLPDGEKSRRSQLKKASTNILCPVKNKDEWRGLETKVRRLQQAIDDCVVITSMIRVTKSTPSHDSVPGLADTKLTNREVPAHFASNLRDLGYFYSILQSWQVGAAPMVMPGPTRSENSSQQKLKQLDTSSHATNFRAHLKASCVAWMHPPSYCHQQFAALFPEPEHRRCGDDRNELPVQAIDAGANGAVVTSAEDEREKAFVSRLLAQHSAQLFGNRIYLCLEERAASALSREAEALFVTEGIDSPAAPSSAGSVCESGAERGPEPCWESPRSSEKKDMVETLHCLKLLQDIYVAGSRGGDGGGGDGIGDGGEGRGVRAQLAASVLRVRAFLNVHAGGSQKDKARTGTSRLGGRAHTRAGGAAGALAACPDVIEATGVGGKVLHFAAATVASLVETEAFAAQRAGSDELRVVASACPHPFLVPLSRAHSSRWAGTAGGPGEEEGRAEASASRPSSRARHSMASEVIPPLGTLFCLVRVTMIDTDNLSGTSGGGGSGGGAAGHRGEGVPASEQSGCGERNELLLMLPLAHDCMRELLRAYLWPAMSQSNAAAAETIGTRFAPASSMSLLPDRAVQRVGIYARNSSPFVSNPEDDPEDITLLHTYALVPDSCLVRSTKADVGRTDDGTKPKRQRQECFYLVQMRSVRGGDADDTDDALLAMLSARTTILRQDSQGMPPSPVPSMDPGGDGAAGAEGSEADALDGGGADDDGAGASKRRWDPAILSSLCRWRSCLCEACPSSGDKHLCSFHRELKAFLDGKVSKSSGPSEASRYLPKAKAPLFASVSAEAKRDLMVIRAASTLMQEMWDGKLQSTLRSFVKKVMVDMSLRPRLEGNLPQPSSKLGHLLRSRAAIFAQIHALGAKDDVAATASPSKRGDEKLADFMASWRVVPATPAWVVWKDELELAKSMTSLGLAEGAANSVLSLEQAVSEEIVALTDLKTFPSAELVLIRKEVKAFKDLQEAAGVSTEGLSGAGADGPKAHENMMAVADAEQRMCNRKLELLRARRHEEQEARAILMKKIARARALEEAQAKDPANFRNQKR